MFVPKSSIDRVVTAFKRLFDNKANDIQTNIQNATSYIMKYINKTLPLSKKENLSKKDKYLNAMLGIANIGLLDLIVVER